ncbi:Uma2 family endonuclease [Polyangium jinanense]|uniref:Uma2 family endonuclease n=1 Tax=Polyangium jinanense TaxID=2829994 RepID=A0A9X3XDA5_9BACT|nr:Uma2 family endonuclease [Polyangium jinanense]MDC3956809.1 Uma2 family endonuclease [Polyangium jinanense]MDC3987195.1 Uma2 family endonuclease [Polyangium jinanense]
MSDPARASKRPKTWEDLADLPEGVVGEIVGGEIVLLPRPSPPHGRAQAKLHAKIGGAFDLGEGGPGGWEIRPEPRIRFGEEIRVPDLAGWRIERFEEPHEGPFLVAPDWVCEILSPSTARSDRTAKLRLYAHHGVRHYWIIDPELQTLEVYRLEGKLWVVAATFDGDVRVRAEPFEAIEIDLSLLWTPRPPTP